MGRVWRRYGVGMAMLGGVGAGQLRRLPGQSGGGDRVGGSGLPGRRDRARRLSKQGRRPCLRVLAAPRWQVSKDPPDERPGQPAGENGCVTLPAAVDWGEDLPSASMTFDGEWCMLARMKSTFLKWTGAVWALAAGMTLAAMAGPSLKVGDPAPKLEMGKWVQGAPVKDFQKGKAYIVEFWAPWCPPCRASIPHLNETYNKFKDKGLIVIGQDCREDDETLVAPFVKKMGDKMTYRVALDDKTANKKGRMAKTWMEAAGRRGIPSAFLVDTKGVIAWIGHPMELEEKVIEDVLAGTYDVGKAATAYKPE